MPWFADVLLPSAARSCPCNYPNNAASNARWCCGDMPHLDMSEWALEKLVKDIGKGVFGISYRTVDCKATIANVRSSFAVQ
jgi:hypothetical protein